jgi:hypothetical protein
LRGQISVQPDNMGPEPADGAGLNHRTAMRETTGERISPSRSML